MVTSVKASTANWYDTSYKYRRAITIDNTSNTSALTNYQVKVTLSSSNFDFTKAQSSGADIRFTDNDGTTLLNYWSESYDSSGQTATLWVKVPTIPASSTYTIYQYYGNSSVSSASSGTNTMLFQDDFSPQTSIIYDDGPFTNDWLPWKDAWKPSAIHYQGIHNRTYLTWVNRHGDILIGYYDHTTGQTSSIYQVAYPSDYINNVVDVGHALPSMTVDNNGYIYIFYGQHYTSLLMRKSTNPEDVSSFSSLNTLPVTGTYPSPIVTRDNKILVLYRNPVCQLQLISSTDGGTTWSSPTQLIQISASCPTNTNPYPWIYPESIMLGSEAGTQSIHILGSHRLDAAGNFAGMYYLKSLDGGTTWKKADGTTITLPATTSTADVIDTDWAYPANMRLNSSNNPYVVYTQNKSVYISYWTGSAWQKNLIAAIETYNIEFPEMDMISDSTIDTYLVSGTVADTPGGNIQRWRSSDGGATWSKAEDITTDGDINTRYSYPNIVRNYQSDIKMFYFKNESYSGGRRITFKSYPTQIPSFYFTNYLQNQYVQFGSSGSSGSWGIRDGQLNMPNGDYGTPQVYKFATNSKFSGNIAVHVSMTSTILAPTRLDRSHSVLFYPKYISSGTNFYFQETQKPTTGIYAFGVFDTSGNSYSQDIPALSLQHKYETDIFGTNVKVYKDSVQQWSGTVPSSISQANAAILFGTYFGVDAYYDNVFVRNFTSPEPSSTAGTEENEPTAPTGSISINSGSSYISSTASTLTISATDNYDPSSTIQMQISNNSDFSGASWESYITSKSWTLTSGDGTKTVYVKFKDSQGNVSSSYSDTIILDTAGPTNVGLISPSSYTTDTKPTLSFKKFTDSGSGISSYSVSLDSGKNKNYSTSGIPANGNSSSDYIWKDDSDVKVELLNENDSDSSNDEIHVYFKGLNNQELTEGKHSWSVTATDSQNNSTTASSDFSIDKTSPSISELAIANVSLVQSGKAYNLSILNRMPSFSGLAADNYQGSTVTNSNGTKDTFDKVSSGPQALNLTFKKQKSDKTYADYLTKDFSLSDIQDTAGDKKSSRFYVTTPYPLVDGYYQVQLTLKDSVGNTYNQPVFYISLNTGVIGQLQNLIDNNGNLETKITKKEEIPVKTEEEKQQVKENGYIVKIKVIDTQNKPITGVKVTIHSKVQETITDKNGIALFNSVEAGQHKILIAYANYTGEQSVNLTGEVKEFDLNIQVKQTNVFFTPQAVVVIGIMGLVIIGLIFLLIKNKRKG